MPSTILKNTYGGQKRWVNFKMLKVGNKVTKVPYSPVTGRSASSTDAKTWSDYDGARAKSDNIGIIFTPLKDLLGIDIDHCLNKDTGEIEHEERDTILKLIKEANTYTEISPSGTGIHLFIDIEGSLTLTANKKAPYEAYTAGRYFTVTENPYKEYDIAVRKMTPDEAVALLRITGYPWGINTEEAPLLTPVASGPLSDNEVLEKMFASKNGAKIKALYDGAGSGDESKDDMALCSHLAFWCGKDATQMERLWTSSPLGSRSKTQKRKDYRDRTLRNAISACKEVYTLTETKVMIKKMKAEEPELQLMTKWVGKFEFNVVNTENVFRILQKHSKYSGRLRYDAFKGIMEYRPAEKWRALEDSDIIDIQTSISMTIPDFHQLGKDMTYDAVVKVSRENEIDSAKDFLSSQVWDGKARLDTWLTRVYGATDDEYHKAVGANWMKGLVKRIMYPGCKFDYVLVLEGPQGSKKSTSLEILGSMEDGSNWHVETTMTTDSKDFFMQFSSKAIIEFSEGETLSRTEVKKMKAIITTQSDKYRPPYGRVSQEFPRRCVFAMTTNESEYLKDDTGNRRWLPVELKIENADIEWLRENRNQLFAEAYHRVVNLKETVHEFPAELTAEIQDSRRVTDVNTDLIVKWYYSLRQHDKDEGITARDVYQLGLKNNMNGFAKPFEKLDEMKITGVLKSVLKLTKKRIMHDGVQTTRWYPSITTTSFMNKLNITPEEDIDEVHKQFEDAVK